ncbi:MAG: hypothetical protein ACT4ON_09120 [Bacteroidota bacterium]
MVKGSVTCLSWMIISVIILLNPTTVTAQKKPGESVITAGAGLSMIGIASSIVVNNLVDEELKVSPTFSGHYDIGLTDFFSLGVAATYQRFKLSYTQDVYNSSGFERVGHYQDKLIRTNYGVRAMFHFAKNEKIDMYAGPRIGYTIWKKSTSNPDTTYIIENNNPWALRLSTASNIGYTAQALFGMRFFFNEYVGINYEVSIGAPTFLTVGINGKF